MTNSFKVEQIRKSHNKDAFDCGEESLNVFLHRYARQNDEKGLGRTFVAVKENDPTVNGYYTIASNSFGFDLVTESLPRYPVPVIQLARLAVDRSVQGQKLGEALLFDAFKRAAMMAEQLGIYAVEVYALNDKARQFYLGYGLTELKDDKLHLYITIKEIRRTLG